MTFPAAAGPVRRRGHAAPPGPAPAAGPPARRPVRTPRLAEGSVSTSLGCFHEAGPAVGSQGVRTAVAASRRIGGLGSANSDRRTRIMQPRLQSAWPRLRATAAGGDLCRGRGGGAGGRGARRLTGVGSVRTRVRVREEWSGSEQPPGQITLPSARSPRHVTRRASVAAVGSLAARSRCRHAATVRRHACRAARADRCPSQRFVLGPEANVRTHAARRLQG